MVRVSVDKILKIVASVYFYWTRGGIVFYMVFKNIEVVCQDHIHMLTEIDEKWKYHRCVMDKYYMDSYYAVLPVYCQCALYPKYSKCSLTSGVMRRSTC